VSIDHRAQAAGSRERGVDDWTGERIGESRDSVASVATDLNQPGTLGRSQARAQLDGTQRRTRGQYCGVPFQPLVDVLDSQDELLIVAIRLSERASALGANRSASGHPRDHRRRHDRLHDRAAW
jgi:hypothetical protein